MIIDLLNNTFPLIYKTRDCTSFKCSTGDDELRATDWERKSIWHSPLELWPIKKSQILHKTRLILFSDSFCSITYNIELVITKRGILNVSCEIASQEDQLIESYK